MPAVGQVRLMDQGTAHSRRSTTPLARCAKHEQSSCGSSLAVLRRVYPVRQADVITNQQPVQCAGGALLGDARALVTGAQQLSGRGVLRPGAVPCGAVPCRAVPCRAVPADV